MPDIDITRIILQYICLLFSLSVHEAAHAAMANYCGDPTARLLGRMTLNPAKHADMMGTVMLPLFAMVTGIPLFGWAKPVPFNPRNLNDRKRGPLWISLAGPGSNMLLVMGSAIILRTLAAFMNIMPDSPVLSMFMLVFVYLAMINILLMLFNLIPVPPLDGHHVLSYFLPPHMEQSLEKLGPYSILILFVLVFQLHILDRPLAFLQALVSFLAFYGTPMWSQLAG